ncbi:MAG: transposase [Chroococcales cyanobacterium metabat2.561]|jgi:IS605 OrfB family transposase|uniref:Transposase n=1 Tax=Microcystis aeruginosa Ma_SC_T_19800800_S464 TaxID=2486257 RepID=A0A552DUU5_MICAE|nr:MAG: transposase [Chroococcales cyanobacterium metabat2.561]TRT85490.1 MAG: transposase [Microcystis aeruginosa Ma_AC_P_19900807_S299]TRU26020.1 MAG: transposase [Microcystis aeruginosa Ma_SC_T_19800800_S464]
MYATQKNQLRQLNQQEFNALTALCRLSKNLFNVALYECRQYFLAERKRLTYESNYHICKSNENYRLLNTDIAQQTMKVVDRSMRSFLGLLKAISIGRCDQRPQLPQYLPKEGYFPLIIPRIKLKDGMFEIPMSREFKKEYGEVKIQLPERLKDKKIKEVRIHPKYSARWFEIEYIYEDETIETSVDSEKAIAIDLGVDNLAACFDTEGHQFLIDGKRLKSINQWYNKRNAELQSAKDKQGIKELTNKQARLNQWRNDSIRDYLNKSARIIINHCLNHQIGKLVVGYNPSIKQEINIGRSNNQNFVQIPFWQLRQKLKALCSRYGIEYCEQEESYSSKASFYDQDEIPIYNADNPIKQKFSGRRVKRGLYETKNRHLVSADINGSANILVKSKHRLNFERVSSGFLANPLRIYVS